MGSGWNDRRSKVKRTVRSRTPRQRRGIFSLLLLAASVPVIAIGLNCGTASQIAYPVLAHGLDWSIAIEDEWTEDAIRLFAENGLVSGETGASTMGGLLALTSRPERHDLELDQDAKVLLIITEGATDPVNYERIVDMSPSAVTANT